MSILLITVFSIGFSTVIGAAGGFLIKQIPHKFNDAILGFSAGIMLAAAILGLIVPAVNLPGAAALWLAVAGVMAGALTISGLDKITPHLHHLAGFEPEKHEHNKSISKVLLFVSAIAIHKFPEGLAAGVSFGTENPGDVLTVAGSISLQNIPEAMVIISPLLAINVSYLRTIFIAVGIGVISMIGTCLGYVLVEITSVALPFMLAFAGGTMLYVISDEIIPETHAHGFEKPATFALIFGFMLIVVFQQLLG